MADFKVQKTLETNLNHFYPALVLQGEEEKHHIDKHESEVQPHWVDDKLINQDFLNKWHQERKPFLESMAKVYPGEITMPDTPFEKFNTRDAVVWIDPLDGTSDYIKGNLPAVSVLIGLSLNGTSRIGIVHQPFSDEDQTKGKTLFGSIEHGTFQLEFDTKMTKEQLEERQPKYLAPFDPLEGVKEGHKIEVACSISHFTQEMKNSKRLV